ncbi:cellulose-binding protein [Kineosporia sp. NBRC 101677]|uniref:lytic polysaccharide monooxygenase n=1 Tax=Kineosporia sp. NBRC 101677 TaxID=3032197 RepID=UPI0024A0DA6C|nr:lytic polysaccharide monooxygenase [Kineosporia sp. NBRC 101677]GLY14564.1 cellulose-binding protein [Kineosporia sp. NBRC 101677]
MLKKVVLPLATMGTLAAGVALAAPASAHGYVSSPPSRQALCASGAVSGCGQIQYEPQSVEAPKGSTKCSGGNAMAAALDDESIDWPHTSVSSTPTFNWTLTARHRTSTWQYYIDGKLVKEFDDKNAIPNATVSHQVDLSAYSGEKTLLAVWNIGDTAMAFYNCIDLNIGGTGSGNGGGNGQPTTAPSTPAETPTEEPTTEEPTTEAPTQEPTEEPSTEAPTTAPTTTAPEDTEAPAEGEWQSWKWYNRGDKVTYDGVTYECRQSHTTLPGWEPPVVLALWLPQ